MTQTSVAQAKDEARAVMRAAVIVAPHRAEMREARTPEPEGDEVRVRLEGCGVCASNIPVWEGREWFKYPAVAGAPGHEGWGVVDKVGSDVKDLHEGERVAFLSSNAYAEYDVAEAGAVVKLPAALDGLPFPGEALGCAMNIFRRSGIEAGHTVAIVGAGFLGALLTQLATNAGARVIAVSRRQFALDVARDCGATETIVTNENRQVVEKVKELTNGAGCERVIEATGKQQPLDLAGELTRERGRLVIAGYHQDGLRQVNMQLWNWRGLDVINAHERETDVYVEGMRLAVEVVAEGTLRPSPLYTHTVSLDNLNEAFELMRERPDGFLKALVTI